MVCVDSQYHSVPPPAPSAKYTGCGSAIKTTRQTLANVAEYEYLPNKPVVETVTLIYLVPYTVLMHWCICQVASCGMYAAHGVLSMRLAAVSIGTPNCPE